MSGFIYPIFGHWVWGPNGFLATMSTPFRDFAGSTVVHTIGGMVALIGAIVLGPRLGNEVVDVFYVRNGTLLNPAKLTDDRCGELREAIADTLSTGGELER